jgi:hypothetical protein
MLKQLESNRCIVLKRIYLFVWGSYNIVKVTLVLIEIANLECLDYIQTVEQKKI